MQNNKMINIKLIFLTLLIINVTAYSQTIINYQANDSSIANPERGWFYSIGAWSNNNLMAFPTLTELDSLRNSNDKVTLIRRYYLLDDYINSPISQSLLDEFQNNCDSLRAAGFKLIPRFTYNFSSALPQNDASVQWTFFHLNQLKPYFEANKNVIAHFEAGLVGKYGEWHTSSEQHVDNWTLEVLSGGHAILDSLLNTVPSDRMVATRYFYHNKMNYLENYHNILNPVDATTAFNGSIASRIGTHNDAIMNDSNWMWHPQFIPAQMTYASEDLKWVVTSGEPLSSGYLLSHNPLPELAFLRFNNLAINANNETSNAHYDYWKQQGYFDELTLKLGYRYRMINAIIDNSVQPGDSLHLILNIENVGYASPYNFRKTELILRNITNLNEYTFDLTNENDIRYWHTGTHSLDFSVYIPNSFQFGEYELFVNFPDADSILGSNPDYSVQLANIGTWKAFTGYNSLLHQLTIGNPLSVAENEYQTIQLFPNPTHSIVNLSQPTEWKLYDIRGKQLIQGLGDSINMEMYSSGVYFVLAGGYTSKIIKY